MKSFHSKHFFRVKALVVVYDYHPLSQTLFDKYFSPSQTPDKEDNIPESVLWSYIIQLSSAIKTIHSAGLAARMIESTKILLTSKNRLAHLNVFLESSFFKIIIMIMIYSLNLILIRIRLNCCGILDIVKYDGGKNLPHHQVLFYTILQ